MKGKNKSAFMSEIEADIRANLEKFRDPVVLGELVYRLLEERENTNRILKNLLQRMEKLEKSIEKAKVRERIREGIKEETQELLPEVDKKIIEYIKIKGAVTAQDIQKAFNYKGRNAASSRLNRLSSQGILVKKQVGRKVYFLLGKA